MDSRPQILDPAVRHETGTTSLRCPASFTAADTFYPTAALEVPANVLPRGPAKLALILRIPFGPACETHAPKAEHRSFTPFASEASWPLHKLLTGQDFSPDKSVILRMLGESRNKSYTGRTRDRCSNAAIVPKCRKPLGLWCLGGSRTPVTLRPSVFELDNFSGS
jgi:hypothetical protein